MDYFVVTRKEKTRQKKRRSMERKYGYMFKTDKGN